MVGGARSGGLEPAWMPVAAFYLSVFDLKYGKFPQTGPGPGQTEFSAVRAYIPLNEGGADRGGFGDGEHAGRMGAGVAPAGQGLPSGGKLRPRQLMTTA